MTTALKQQTSQRASSQARIDKATSSNRPMGVGFVGCGGHAAGCNIPLAVANPNLNIVGMCDLQMDRVKQLSETYPCDLLTTDAEKLIADPRVQMVICATKPDCRWGIMELAVRHRKPLFVEKPLAYTAEESIRMAEMIARSGIPFCVGFNRPYSPMMQAIAPVYRRNRDEAGHTLIHYRIVGEADVWPESHKQAVLVNHESTIVHETTHVFDLLNWLTGQMPTRVHTAGAGHIDNIITLTYGRNITASIMAGDNGTVGYNKERLEINTHSSTIIGDMFVEMLALNVDGGKRIRRRFPYTFEGRTFRTSGEALARHWWKWRSRVTPEQQAVGHYFGHTPEVDKGHGAQLEQFRRDILDGKAHETGALQGAMATVLAWHAMESWECGQAVTLDHHWIREIQDIEASVASGNGK